MSQNSTCLCPWLSWCMTWKTTYCVVFVTGEQWCNAAGTSSRSTTSSLSGDSTRECLVSLAAPGLTPPSVIWSENSSTWEPMRNTFRECELFFGCVCIVNIMSSYEYFYWRTITVVCLLSAVEIQQINVTCTVQTYASVILGCVYMIYRAVALDYT